MTLAIAALLVLVATAASITAMLLVRRRAPDGGYFADGDRAAGVFGVLATGFSVLLGFLIFLASENYDVSRSGADTEAVTVAEQVQTAQFLPGAVSEKLTGELVCYARWVVNEEWDRMEDGTLALDLNPWGAAMFQTLRTVEPETASEQAAYSKWLDQTSDRQLARQDRIHGAVGVIPSPLWIVLFLVGAIILVYLLFFADSGERAKVQALLIGSVVATIVAMLLLLRFLDDPYHPGLGSLQPKAMERTLLLIDEQLEIVGMTVDFPCDDNGHEL